MGARVVEGTGLENRQGLTLLVGSNPTPSANFFFIGISFIDDIIDQHSGVHSSDAKAGKRKKAGGSPGVSRRSRGGTGVHKGGTKNRG